jgi:hypothetical protein
VKFFNASLILVIGFASVVFAHATKEVHPPLAEKAWERIGFIPDIPDVCAAKTELISGAREKIMTQTCGVTIINCTTFRGLLCTATVL